MKNLFKLMSILFTLSVTFFHAQQTERKVKIACYKSSCCSFGAFDIDLISTNHCFYIITNKDGSQQNIYSSHFESTNPIKDGTVNIGEDIIMPQFKDETGNPLVLPKGEYKIINNEIEYSLVSKKFQIKVSCVQEHVTGTILGHEVDYTITLCVYYPWYGKSGSASVKLELNDSQKEEIRRNNNFVNFKNDITVKNTNGTFVIKAGDYFMNDNNEVYIINSIVE